ncbi:MAG: hypothetical protein PHC61_15920, partial [Chitinivibrionales bacterium]|nr:hypothetical protein [Chitinivibrionales bacterium]
GVKAALDNARFYPKTNTVSFFAHRIGDASFLRLLPRPGCHAEAVLADPPRQGIPENVIAAIAGRRPLKVVQACCGVDELPGQIFVWQKTGFAPTKILPLDMFAGTPHLEIFVLFEFVKIAKTKGSYARHAG